MRCNRGASMTNTRLTWISCFCVLAACGAAAPMGDDDGGGTPVTIAGRYALHSNYDLTTSLPGTAGEVVNVFIAATDGPDDPTRYIVDLLIAELPDGSVKQFATSSAPFVAGYLNDRLTEVAPDFVSRIIAIGNKFGQAAHRFGMIELLDIDKNGKGTHTVSGVHFDIDQVPIDFAFADEGQPDVVVPNIAVTLDSTYTVKIAKHAVPLSYGQVLRLALDKAIIPAIDPAADDLSDLLHRLVDCGAVGHYVYEALGVGSASGFASACDSGLTAGANVVYAQIDSVDGTALQFAIAGTAKAVDTNTDATLDRLQTGVWSGELSYANTPAPLGKATFYGERL
jgi:hypothetical protein